MKALVLHCPSGISGDMALAALADLGFPLERLNGALAAAGLEGVVVASTRRTSGPLAALAVKVEATNPQPPRRYGEVREIILRTGLDAAAQALALDVLARLAEVEARLHGVGVDEVHLHEIGAWDTIADVVGFAMGLEHLGVAAVYVSAIETGTGVVRTEHGVLPVPAPATMAHLVGFDLTSTVRESELTTPTGAALLAASARPLSELAGYRLLATGKGAGNLELEDRPNVLYASLVEAAPLPVPEAGLLTLLETNLDDRGGEAVAAAVEALLRQGALDAWVAPVTGKKGRPALVLSAICRNELGDLLAEEVMRATGSLGVRLSTFVRSAGSRRIVEVRHAGRAYRVKVGPYSSKIEFDDLAAASAELGVPLLELSREIALAFHRQNPELPLPQ